MEAMLCHGAVLKEGTYDGKAYENVTLFCTVPKRDYASNIKSYAGEVIQEFKTTPTVLKDLGYTLDFLVGKKVELYYNKWGRITDLAVVDA